MATVQVTEEEFSALYENNDIVVLDFWAGWCQPCHQFAPVFEEASEKHTEAVFGKIETEQQPDLAKYFGIRSIPTIIIIRDKIEIFRHSGVLAAVDLDAIINKTKELDMDEVNRIVDEEEKKIQ